MCLMVYKELEGLVNFIVDILRLHLLGDEIRDDGVNPEVELLDGLLSVLTATLGTLQAVQQHFDLRLFDVKLRQGSGKDRQGRVIKRPLKAPERP